MIEKNVTKIPGRVLMTADTVGGVWTYAVELARALEPYGVEICLATMGGRPDERQLAEAREVPNLNLFKSEYRLEWMENAWSDVRLAGEWLLHLERRLQPDLVHLNGYVHADLSWQTPKLVVGHSCVLSWWQAVRKTEFPVHLDQYRQKVARGLQAADLVAAPTRAMLDALEEIYGPLRKTAVVPNGRDAARFKPRKKEDFVLAAGRLWDEAKNIAALARIAPQINCPVFVAGDERHPDGGVAEFDDVYLLGRLSSELLAHWFSRAAVYCLPARYEPFGLSALEAALAGCALVLGDVPSLREVWQDAALFVAPDDDAALADALNRLSKDRIYREQMARKARVRAVEFAPDRMAKNYLAAYSQLLGESSAAAQQQEEAAACAS